MKTLVVRNSSGRSIPLQGSDGSNMTLLAHSTASLGPEYYEHYHFKSLRKKGMLVVLREEEKPPPSPKSSKASSKKPKDKSSPPRQRPKKTKAQDQTEGGKDTSEVMNADGA